MARKAATGRRVLITGVAGELAGQLAVRLEADDRIASIVGVDLQDPRHPLERTEFVRADLRNPMVGRVLESAEIDTIVHLAVTATPQRAGGRARMKELNVIGTMQLLGAAQKAARLRKLIVKSTTAVYGSSANNPALVRETVEPGGTSSGYSKDAVEVESYARGFGRRRSDVTLTILRFANFVGPTVQTPLTSYLALPVVPTVLGYDPRLQLCHESDAVEILYRSVVGDHAGIYNVAGPGVVYLSQALRLAGRPSVPIPLPFANGIAGLFRRSGRMDFSPEQLQFLLFGRVGDIDRMRREFDYEPEHTTKSALLDFLQTRRIAALIDRDRAERWEQELFDFITRKGQERHLSETPG